MSYIYASWVEQLPAEITVCDKSGILIGMNSCAEELFKEDGGSGLIGSDALACHPEPSRSKFAGMLVIPSQNAYLNTEKDEKRFFFQSPWTMNRKCAGFVEISFEVPEKIPQIVEE
jgi:hypothetical protein